MGVIGITEANCFQPEHPLASVIEGTGVLVLGGESRIDMCTEWPKPRLDYWGGKHSDPSLQANEPSRHPAKTLFKCSI